MSGKTAYSQKELDELRERLLAEQVELQEQLATIEEQSFATSQSDISGEVSFDEENADAGTFTFERERDLSIENNVRDLLGKTDRALNGPALSGHVVDFIDFHVWPVFNVADSAIVAGAILLAVVTGRRERSFADEKRNERPPKREELAGGA